MGSTIIFMILLQVVLILLNAVFACAEIAVISMNDNKMEKMAEEGDKRAKRLVKLTSQPARFLATIQVAITLSGFLGSAFAAENFSDVLVKGIQGLGIAIPVQVLESVSVILITIVLSYFTLVFGELVPKQIAMRKAEPFALGISALIDGISKIFSPLVSFLTFSTNSVLKLLGIDTDKEEEQVSEEEIRMMVDVGTEKGTIDCEEREFIQNVFEFDDLSAEEIVTHRTDVVMLDMEDDMETWRETIYHTRYTMYPICEETADKIIGVLNAKEYFRLEDKSRSVVMEHAVSQPYFVPDTVKADVLFRNMKKKKCSMAIVLDEYGGMTGIVTLNDLIEQVVGELEEDTFPELEPLENGAWKVRGTALLEEMSEMLAIPLPSEEYDTFNGLVFHALGSIPQDGTEMSLEIDRLCITDMKIHNHKVESAVVTIKETSDMEQSEEERK